MPVPEVASLRELNELINDYDRADDDRRIGHRAHTVAESFSAERQLLKPLPVEPFETGLWLALAVDRCYAQITVRTNRYSMPSRLIGRQVRVLLNASDLTVYDSRTLVTTHERMLTKGGACLTWTTTWRRFVRKALVPSRATALNKPALLASSPPPMTRGGRRPARLTVTPKAPARSSKSFCCTAIPTHVVAGITAALHAGH